MIKILDKMMLDSLSREARALPRRRKNLNLHQSLDEPVQKLFIAMQADSYVRPHRHPEQEKTEFFLAIRGHFSALIFDERGRVSERIDFSAGGDVFGAEIRPNTWHSVIALENDSVFFELKQGPYIALSDKDFASWAPEENTADVKPYIQWMRQAGPGDSSGFP